MKELKKGKDYASWQKEIGQIYNNGFTSPFGVNC